jgi:nicotinate-nucleotide--dimethylbenzimidazole phosphoribosyltransferase
LSGPSSHTGREALLRETVAAIRPPDGAAMAATRARLDALTKPPGSLGRLEELAVQLAGIGGAPPAGYRRPVVVVMAGDHGVTAEGVSAYPSEVTAQMVGNFLAGGAAINVLARQAGAEVRVVDLGVAAELPDHPLLVKRKVGYGTANLARGPAMTREQALEAIGVGIEVARAEVAAGADLLLTGDMGIGNTTPSSAIVAALSGEPPRLVTGRGTGLDARGLRQKVRVIERALRRNTPDGTDPLGVLAGVGGFEIGGLTGLILGGAAARVPVLLDGFISGAAALLAGRLAPAARANMVAAHQSVEIGHRVILRELGLRPLLTLDLRLGEGTGAALALHLVAAATRILWEMATFSEAGVSDRPEVAGAAAG